MPGLFQLVNHSGGLAAERILAHAPANVVKIFFTNGGADANENAIRMVRLHTGRVFPGGLTYSGHPLAAATIVASIDAFEEENIVENAERLGRDYLAPGLAALAARHPVIGEVRAAAYFWPWSWCRTARHASRFDRRSRD